MIGVEIDLIVSDSVRALELYQAIFETELIEVTNYPLGLNEAVFSIYGTRFHLLDENAEYKMIAPLPGDKRTMWVNLMVPDIAATWGKAMAAGCTEIQGIVDMPEIGVKNAMFIDPFNCLWMLHEITREVSFEERCKILEQQMGIEK